MREPQYSILADIQDAIERAKQGKLALYWQRTIGNTVAKKSPLPNSKRMSSCKAFFPRFRNGTMKKICAPTWRKLAAGSGIATTGRSITPW